MTAVLLRHFFSGEKSGLATERLSLLPNGRLLYRLKRHWRGGTSRMIFEPTELVEKLAALVPPPRFNLVRYHGILATSAAWSPLVIAESNTCDSTIHRDCPARTQLRSPGTANANKKGTFFTRYQALIAMNSCARLERSLL